MIINKRILKTGALAAAMTIVFAIFAFRAAEWTKGLDSEFIVYGQATGGSTGTNTGGGTTGGGTTVIKIIPQIAAGNYGDIEPRKYGTIIEIVNTNTTAITISGNLYNENGTSSTLTGTTNLPSQPTFAGSFNNLSLAANAILVIEFGTNTSNTPSGPTTNWGKFTASGAITVASFFELRDSVSNLLYSRVGVPASPPDMTKFIIPRVRQVSTGIGIAEIDAGFALVNTGSAAANVTATIKDANGNTVGAPKVVTLLAGAHTAAFANQFFSLTGSEVSGRQYQYIQFQSSSPSIAAAALAFEGGSQTSFPVDVLQ